jgi:hypothetical protein
MAPCHYRRRYRLLLSLSLVPSASWLWRSALKVLQRRLNNDIVRDYEKELQRMKSCLNQRGTGKSLAEKNEREM